MPTLTGTGYHDRLLYTHPRGSFLTGRTYFTFRSFTLRETVDSKCKGKELGTLRLGQLRTSVGITLGLLRRRCEFPFVPSFHSSGSRNYYSNSGSVDVDF